jgi:hypothetical protein
VCEREREGGRDVIRKGKREARKEKRREKKEGDKIYRCKVQ